MAKQSGTFSEESPCEDRGEHAGEDRGEHAGERDGWRVTDSALTSCSSIFSVIALIITSSAVVACRKRLATFDTPHAGGGDLLHLVEAQGIKAES